MYLPYNCNKAIHVLYSRITLLILLFTPMITTTEKLLLATAVKLFGNNNTKIRLYMVSRSPSFAVKEWENIYKGMVDEAKKHGYSDVSDYCEDIRYAKMLEVYREKINTLNTLDPVSMEEYREEKVVKEVSTDSKWELVRSFYTCENKVPYLCIRKGSSRESMVSLPGDAFRSSVHNARSGDYDLLRDQKTSKRLWTRMSDQERTFEDHFTKIESQLYFGGTTKAKLSMNPLRFYFPNYTDTEEMYLEKAAKKPATREEQYIRVVNKLLYNKKTTKDRSMWPGEYKTMAKYLIEVVKEKDLNSPAIPLLQKTISEIKDLSLQHAVIKAMEITQRCIFESKDAVFEKKVNTFKHRFSLLYDFYKR